MPTLRLDLNAAPVTPVDAATLVVARDDRGGGVEIFCVERQKRGFLGGAVVFPGGKVDPDDADAGWLACANEARAPRTPMAVDAVAQRALTIAACREALEEAAILPLEGTLVACADLLDWRSKIEAGTDRLRDLLIAAGLRLDLAALRPFARWITPAAEPRRFDTRFFLFVADPALRGEHDGHETTASFWATPRDVLRRFGAGELQLAPPTHRVLEVLAGARNASDALAIADAACLDPICPRAVRVQSTDVSAMRQRRAGDGQGER